MRHVGYVLAITLAMLPIAASAVPLLTLNESNAENIETATYDAGAGVITLKLDVGGKSTEGIPGLALTADQLGLYTQAKDGAKFEKAGGGILCDDTIGGDCVRLDLNAAGLVRVNGFGSNKFDPPDAADVESFDIGPAGAPVLTVKISSKLELAPEPGGITLLGVALAGIVWVRRGIGARLRAKPMRSV